MSPDQARSTYRRQVAASGETISIRRYTGTGPDRPRFDTEVRARVLGYEMDEIVGSIQQGDRKVIVLVEDLEAALFAFPVVPLSDKAVVRGKELTIKAVDDSTRRVRGVLIAYELQVGG
ncbi:MAG: hypothetical protein KIS96_03495 [Bauldia sp.]|nr:hypothetical protein [Bauldia sp.]